MRLKFFAAIVIMVGVASGCGVDRTESRSVIQASANDNEMLEKIIGTFDGRVKGNGDPCTVEITKAWWGKIKVTVTSGERLFRANFDDDDVKNAIRPDDLGNVFGRVQKSAGFLEHKTHQADFHFKTGDKEDLNRVKFTYTESQAGWVKTRKSLDCHNLSLINP